MDVCKWCMRPTDQGFIEFWECKEGRIKLVVERQNGKIIILTQFVDIRHQSFSVVLIQRWAQSLCMWNEESPGRGILDKDDLLSCILRGPSEGWDREESRAEEQCQVIKHCFFAKGLSLTRNKLERQSPPLCSCHYNGRYAWGGVYQKPGNRADF